MNLPNKLTTLRVIMIPFFVFFLLWQNGENHTFRIGGVVDSGYSGACVCHDDLCLDRAGADDCVTC